MEKKKGTVSRLEMKATELKDKQKLNRKGTDNFGESTSRIQKTEEEKKRRKAGNGGSFFPDVD